MSLNQLQRNYYKVDALRARPRGVDVPQTYDVIPPSGWTWALPFTIQQNVRTFTIKSGWNISDYAPTGKTYWVKRDGNDANTGLSEAQALQRIKTALAKADVDVIMVKAGTYENGYGWENVAPARNIAVYGYGGNVIISRMVSGLAWALTAGMSYTYEAFYTSNISLVLDWLALDSYSDPAALTYKTSIALVEANAGSWWYDPVADRIYVHTTSPRIPDTNIWCIYGDANGRMNDAVTYYLEGLSFIGGGTVIFQVDGAANMKLYAKDCDFKFTSNALNYDGFTISATGSGTCIMQGCTFAHSTNDGIHLEGLFNLALIDCVSHDHGLVGATNANCYFSHVANQTVIIGGDFSRSYGPIVNDIGVSQNLWMLGCHNHDSLSAGVNDCNYMSSSGAATLWLDCCESSGSTYDLYANLPSSIFVRSLVSNTFNTGGTGAGNISAY